MQDITKANNEYLIKHLLPKVGAYDLSKSCSLIWMLSWLSTCWVLTRWKFIDLMKSSCSGPDHSNRPKCVRLSEAARSARHDEQNRDGAELRRANWRRFQVTITGFPCCVRFISHVGSWYLSYYNFILRFLIPSLKVLWSKRNRHDPEIRRSDAIWGLERISKISLSTHKWLTYSSWLESWRESQRGGDWRSFGRGWPRGGRIHMLYGLLCD